MPTLGSPSKPLRFLLVSLLFHLLFTVSIFDIYFTSPVVHPTRRFSVRDTYGDDGLQDHPNQDTYQNNPPQPPADRLVLIVGDGLRADTLYKEHETESMLPDWAVGLNGEELQSAALALDKSRSTSATHTSTKQPPPSFFAAPHIRDIILHRGSWGISHTRVPTESRPGHVALIAGMYEDVSAVTKGWKLNPVDFDSLMNVSTHAYTFGSPDILPMFAKGVSPADKVDMWMYDESAEDFTKDAAQLDLWVLQRVEELFQRAAQDEELNRQIRQKGNVFFLHLLGLDTTGHTYRPHSKEYVGNLIVVDAIVKRVEALFNDFFNDDKRTAWVFSADHGMSSKGNHGDGEPENTRTPLVAWGAGVRGPREINWQEDGVELARREREAEEDQQRTSATGVMERISARGDPMPAESTKALAGYFDNWTGLDRLARIDVEQADVTTLMATLLGLPLPANSEGRLPLEYLTLNDEQAARAMLTNALEVLEIYRVKHEQRAQRMLRYVPFTQLPPQGEHLPGTSEVQAIKKQIAVGQYTSAITHSRELIDLALQGATYLQTYDWLLLVCIISAGYIGSILYGIIFVLKTYAGVEGGVAKAGSLTLGRALAAPILAAFYAKFSAEQAPLTYYAYLAFTVLYWVRVIDERRVFAAAWTQSSSNPGRPLIVRLLLLTAFSAGTLELIVLGYLQRWAWTLGFFFLGFAWPFLTFNDVQRSKNEGLLFLWGISCVACALFTLSGVEKEESPILLGLSGVVFLFAGAVVERHASKILGSSPTLQRTVGVLKFQLLLVVTATIVTLSSSYNLKNKNGLPVVNQVIGWAVLLLTGTVPFIVGFQRKQPAHERLTLIIFSAAPVFVILSIRDEALFFAAYTGMLVVWAKVEGAVLEEDVLGDSRRRMNEKKDAAQKGTIAGHSQDTEGSGGSSSPQTNPTSTHPSTTTPPPPTLTLTLPRSLSLNETRLSLTFLFLLHVGFFGTGNVASISSFYLSPVYRLIPIFSPFAMAALLILKILLPFCILISVFHFLVTGRPSGRVLGEYLPGDEPHGPRGRHASGDDQSKKKPPSREAVLLSGPPLLGPDSIGGLGLASPHGPIVVASIATDVLAIHFLFSVRTSGAWLEIGRTITHFAMANLLEVFMFALSLGVDALY